MPKPKNNGSLLSVRLSTHGHRCIMGVMEKLVKTGERPGAVTKTMVVELAVREYLARAFTGTAVVTPADLLKEELETEAANA